MKRELCAPLRNEPGLTSSSGSPPRALPPSVTLRKSAAAALIVVCAPAFVACSGEEGRSREEDTTTGANQPGAGSSYTPSSGGPTDAPPATEASGGTGPNIVVANDWVDRASNGVGIQGAFFTYQDPTTRTTITAAPGGTGQGYCISGESAEVLEMNFAGTWGAVAALNLNQDVGSTAAGSYDAAANGVVGFGFDIVGDTAGALRFVVKQYSVHDGFCINNVPDCAMGCSVEYRIEELTQNCWTPGGATPNASALSALEWQITTKTGMATPFDYCIENIHAVMGEPAAASAAAGAAPQ
jgi:hypothetical protein